MYRNIDSWFSASLAGRSTNATQDLVGPESTQPGDLVLFRGSDRVSKMIRDLDRGYYDHCGVVVGHSESGQPIVVDQNFRGYTKWEIGQYEFRPEAVLVRRHRIGGHGQLFAQRALDYGERHAGYAFGRLANIMLVSLVRSLPDIEAMTADRKQRFVQRMTAIFALAHSQRGRSDIGVCVGLPLFVFDTVPSGRGSSVEPYCGLHLETHDIGGFAEWFPAVSRFCEMLVEFAEPGCNPHPMDTLLQLVGDGIEPGEDGGAGETTAQQLARHPWACGNPALVVAAGLLDRFLKERVVVTPRDMETTRSLFDVGRLDLESIDWSDQSSGAKPLASSHSES